MDILAEFGGVANLTSSAILGVVVWMILTDRLVTKARLDAMTAERDAWKKAAETSEAARKETDIASWKAVHALTSVERVLSALSPPKEEGGATNVAVS